MGEKSLLVGEEGVVAEIKNKVPAADNEKKKNTLKNTTSGDSGYADVSANPNPKINH